MWIDTHCHLDAPEFAGNERRIAVEAAKEGICHIVIPSIDRPGFARVTELAHTCANCSCALGIHPLYVAGSDENDAGEVQPARLEADFNFAQAQQEAEQSFSACGGSARDGLFILKAGPNLLALFAVDDGRSGVLTERKFSL